MLRVDGLTILFFKCKILGKKYNNKKPVQKII